MASHHQSGHEPPALSIGYFSPDIEIGDVSAFCARIRDICGPSSAAFPFVLSPVKTDDGLTGLSYGVLRGHVPVHIDRPNAAELCSTVFTFVLEADNRPVLLYSPAGQLESQCILVPDQMKVPTMRFGAVELWAGKALYFDLARAWHGITGFPTGDPTAELPEAVVIQVPWRDKRDIAGAINKMKSIVSADDRFADLTGRPRTRVQ